MSDYNDDDSTNGWISRAYRDDIQTSDAPTRTPSHFSHDIFDHQEKFKKKNEFEYFDKSIFISPKEMLIPRTEERRQQEKHKLVLIETKNQNSDSRRADGLIDFRSGPVSILFSLLLWLWLESYHWFRIESSPAYLLIYHSFYMIVSSINCKCEYRMLWVPHCAISDFFQQIRSVLKRK